MPHAYIHIEGHPSHYFIMIIFTNLPLYMIPVLNTNQVPHLHMDIFFLNHIHMVPYTIIHVNTTKQFTHIINSIKKIILERISK